MRKRPLLLIACVFLAGLVYKSYEIKEILFVLLVLLLREFCIGIKSSENKNVQRKRMAGRGIVLLSAFLIGSFRMNAELQFRDAYLSKIVDDSKGIVWGEITKIESKDTTNRIYLSDSYISLNNEVLPCNDVLVYTSSNYYQIGQIHKISGQLHTFKDATNEGNFNQRKFYQSQKIDFYLIEEKSELLARDVSAWKQGLLGLKEQIRNVYTSYFSEDAAAFYIGMILGDKSGVEEEIKDLFTISGISHILAISGLHVSIIGRGLYQRLRKKKLSFLIAGFLAGVVLIGYCFMVGSSMSAVRATGMMIIFFIGQIIGRSYDMLNALGAVALYLLWDNPFLIEYSGFWFSMLALIGIGYVGQEFATVTQKGKGMLVSAGITVTTLPLVAFCYYEIPLYSVIVNWLVIPLLSPIFALALIGGVLGMIVPIVAQVLFFPCEYLYRFLVGVCQTIAKLPLSSIITGIPSWKRIIAYYMVLLFGVFLLRYLNAKEIAFVKRKMVLFITVIICFFLIICPSKKEVEITFLDVGQGDGIYLCDGKQSFFIDGGSVDVANVGEYRILPFLKAKGVRKIDYWFVTHADTDHISGLLEILRNGYRIENLVVADACPKDENYERLTEAAVEQGISIIHMKAGEKIVSRNVIIHCLYPGALESEDRNDASLVLEVAMNEEGKELLALFTGDISAEVEQQLLQTTSLREVAVYKASHHGSKSANSEALLSAIKPKQTIISCGKENSYGHPHEETLDRLRDIGSVIRSTAESGQITIKIEDVGE